MTLLKIDMRLEKDNDVLEVTISKKKIVRLDAF